MLGALPSYAHAQRSSGPPFSTPQPDPTSTACTALRGLTLASPVEKLCSTRAVITSVPSSRASAQAVPRGCWVLSTTVPFVGHLNAQFWAMESFSSFTSNRKSTLVIPDNTEVCEPDYTKLLFPLHHKDSHSWLINTSPSFTGQKLKWLFTGSTYTIGTLQYFSNKESPMFQLTVGCEYKVIHKLQLQQLPDSYLANTSVK